MQNFLSFCWLDFSQTLVILVTLVTFGSPETSLENVQKIPYFSLDMPKNG